NLTAPSNRRLNVHNMYTPLKIACDFAERKRWKIFEKNLEFGTTGGRGSEFCFRTTTPLIVPSAKF
ncbi:hypothetical protein, partial [Enterococcus sp. DIV2371]|uniref:hypothetical protein n=1 Tax=Enterococcus sp. DIV2371 TaxID=2774927 RepID=UPI003D29E16D